MPGALSHIRVLDLSRVLAGPWAGQILADLGAEVIKIERPGSGDDTRAWGPPFLKDAEGNDTSEAAYYLSANRNKKSVTVDFTQPEGQRIVRELAAKADILLENFKVGGLKAYGLDYESLKQVNPKLIYCSITGFGQSGPYAKRAGYDFMIQGLGGLMSLTGRADNEEGAGPVKVGVALTDILTGLYSSTAVLAALAHRDVSGIGQHIDMALLDVQVACLANQTLNYLTTACGPINDLAQVFADPQVQARGLRVELPHPLAGTVPQVASPIRLSETPVEYRNPPPTLGQHTDEVLETLLGLDAAALERLRDGKVI
ncbi:CaiB/BaiF CoA transferase family protein [Pseudomonas aeruginosa]|uniref:CaiB/BaiF CoA transferase family protein n=1 Tax=Pseudomonas aeruginosa TaxID=287 RepID=UPI0011E5C029|nr:CaiB/BaiF CoA-transferase family protein [Pseudomonas aeruginosa]